MALAIESPKNTRVMWPKTRDRLSSPSLVIRASHASLSQVALVSLASHSRVARQLHASYTRVFVKLPCTDWYWN